MVCYKGLLKSKQDAMLLIKATSIGVLKRLHSRLSEQEKARITSGDIFVLSEQESNVKRWTDGFNWSASRMQGDFLIYKRITNGFVENMFKKVLSIHIDNQKFHVISYYTPECMLKSPLEDEELKRKIYECEGREIMSPMDNTLSGMYEEKKSKQYSPITPLSAEEKNGFPHIFTRQPIQPQQPQQQRQQQQKHQQQQQHQHYPQMHQSQMAGSITRYTIDQKHISLLNDLFY